MYHFSKRWFSLLWGIGLSIVLWGQSESPYHLSFKRELLYFGGGTAGTLFGNYLKANTPDLMLSDLELEGVNSFDRIATRFSSEQAEKWSDYSLFASAGLTFLLVAPKETRRDFGKIALLFGEAMLINQTFTDVIKSVSRRPRPYVFDENLDPSTVISSNDRASFLSGHTSGSAAASFFFARVFTDYYPESKLKPYVWGLAIGLPALTGYLRIKAGQHYPTDVIAGYALGAGIGNLLPMLHKRPISTKGLTLSPTGNGVYLCYPF